MRFSKPLQTVLLGAGLVLTAMPTLAGGFAVHANCSVSPCVMGVAEVGYAVPGNARYTEGWRQTSQTYADTPTALRTMCRWHYGRAGYSAPGIANGDVNCASLCGGNAACP